MIAPLLLAAAVVANVAAAAPPPPRLERVLDAGGHDVAAIATIERTEGRVRWSLVLVRRPGAEDLFVGLRRLLEAQDGTALHALWTAGRSPLRLERLADGRLSAAGGARAVRWFEDDARTKTVRCALISATEAADARLVPAAAEYGALKQALGEVSWSELELPLRLLRALAPERPSVPATCRRVPVPEEDSGAEALRRDAEAAYSDALRFP